MVGAVSAPPAPRRSPFRRLGGLSNSILPIYFSLIFTYRSTAPEFVAPLLDTAPQPRSASTGARGTVHETCKRVGSPNYSLVLVSPGRPREDARARRRFDASLPCLVLPTPAARHDYSMPADDSTPCLIWGMGRIVRYGFDQWYSYCDVQWPWGQAKFWCRCVAVRQGNVRTARDLRAVRSPAAAQE